MTHPRESPAAYRELLERLDRWFAQARKARPGVIPCTGGCSACCHGPFDISVADAELLAAAVNALPDAERREIRSRAGGLFARMRAYLPDWDAPHDIASVGDDAFDRMSDALSAEPCPLLGEGGACRVYADRPFVCRITGLGMVTPAGRVIENLCPIQERFPAYRALAPVPFDLEGLEVDELDALQAAARRLLGSADRHDYETTIATAIVDFTAPDPSPMRDGYPAMPSTMR